MERNGQMLQTVANEHDCPVSARTYFKIGGGLNFMLLLFNTIKFYGVIVM
jgi:hypothetical protein